MGRLETTLMDVECAVCGERKQPGESWFVITENYWEDRIQVWKWSPQTVQEETAHAVCSQRHVRELVVHWMTTGCLHYPFATVPFQPARVARGPFWRSSGIESVPTRTLLGELAVDREAISRVLRNNPLSLNAVLDELTIALEEQVADDGEGERDDEPFFAVRTV